MRFSLPQGSVLGPKGFIQYAEDVATVLVKHGLIHLNRLYADDMQWLKHGKPVVAIDVPAIVAVHEACVAEVSSLCASKRLQLNDDKTKMFWFGSAVNLHKMAPHSGDMRVGDSVVTPVFVVRDLGVLFDAELSMREHFSKTAQTCFYHLRRLRSVRHQLGREVTAKLFSAFVLSRLDYCNAVLVGLPATTLAPPSEFSMRQLVWCLNVGRVIM